MGAIDKESEVLRQPETCGRRKKAGRLVAPGRIKGMLADRQQLDMGKAHFGGIGQKIFGQFAIVEKASIAVAFPRTQMHFIDGHRAAALILFAPRLQIVLIAPAERLRRRDD